jgi:hypothetical protein
MEAGALFIGPYPSEGAAWARALVLLTSEPWQPRVIVDGARVVAETGAPELPLPKAADLAAATGARVGRLLVARAGGYAVPGHELPAGTQESAVLTAGKRDRSIVITGEREVCDEAKAECLGWYQVIMAVQGGLGVAWVPMSQLFVPGKGLEIRRLGRSPEGITYDVVTKNGSRTYCLVDAAGPQPTRAEKGKGHDGAVIYGADGARVGHCDRYALKPLGED